MQLTAGDAPRHAVDGLVDVLFRRATLPRLEELQEGAADRFILLARLIATGSEPCQQRVELLLAEECSP